MRNLILFIVIITFISCKTSEKQVVKNPLIAIAKGKNVGVISHQYKAEGCKTIIVINKANDKPMHLIPMNELDTKFDKDNLKISFDYLPLRVKNPEGCNMGIPAEISNIAVEGK